MCMMKTMRQGAEGVTLACVACLAVAVAEDCQNVLLLTCVSRSFPATPSSPYNSTATRQAVFQMQKAHYHSPS
jgi:hypothetical protein